jgi:hypothetical protein
MLEEEAPVTNMDCVECGRQEGVIRCLDCSASPLFAGHAAALRIKSSTHIVFSVGMVNISEQVPLGKWFGV